MFRSPTMRPLRLLAPLAIVAGCLALPASPAFACGGFACSNSAPVVQAAERILYVRDGSALHIHIGLDYEGPSESFSWILPLTKAPAEGGLNTGSELIFGRLAAVSEPILRRTSLPTPGCEIPQPCPFLSPGAEQDASGGVGWIDAGGSGPPPTPEVEVLQQAEVGPFETVVIAAASGTDAVLWLEQNGYDTPPGAEPLFESYIAKGDKLLALKLKKGANAGSIVPIVVTLEDVPPCLPLRLTQIASVAELPVIAYFLDAGRVVPKNLFEVVPNLLALRWLGSNVERGWRDLVSMALDQGGGAAFITDFAGAHGLAAGDMALPFNPADIDASLPPATRLMSLTAKMNTLSPAERTVVLDGIRAAFDGVSLQDEDWLWIEAMGSCPPHAEKASCADEPWTLCGFCYLLQKAASDEPARVDAAFASVQAHFDALSVLAEQVGKLPALTRLVMAISPSEMSLDPMFATDPSQPDVDRYRDAIITPACPPGSDQATHLRITTEDGGTRVVQYVFDEGCWNGPDFFPGQVIESPTSVETSWSSNNLASQGGQPLLALRVHDETTAMRLVEPKQAEAISAWIMDAVEGGATLSSDEVSNLAPITWDAYEGVETGPQLTGFGHVVVPVGGEGGGGGGGSDADAGALLDSGAVGSGNEWDTPVVLVDPNGDGGGGGGGGGTGAAPSGDKGGSSGCTATPTSPGKAAPIGALGVVAVALAVWWRRRRTV